MKAAALELGLPVTDRIDDLLTLDPPAELGVVVAFGRIIKPHILAAVPMVNLHFSLLPRWRGAAPVERAILAGDERTGVCVMDVEEGLDTGRCIGARKSRSPPTRPPTSCGPRSSRWAPLVARRARHLASVSASRPDGRAGMYAHKIDPAELEIDWTLSPTEVHRLVRVGGAWTTTTASD